MTDPTTDPSASIPDPSASTPPPIPPSPPSTPAGQSEPLDPWRDRARWQRVGDLSSLAWGAIFVAVGVWFFVEQTLGYDLPNVDWGVVWPIVLIALGGWVVLRAMGRRAA